jgi:hypothetical protein
LNHEIAELGRKISATVLPLRHHQTGDFGEICNLALEIGCLKGDVTETFGVDHPALPEMLYPFWRRRMRLLCAA